MIYLIYGEDTASSRNKLLTLIDKTTNVVRIDGKKQTIGDVLDSLTSNSLFESNRTIIIEFFSKLKPIERIADALGPYIKDVSTQIVLWDEEVDKKVLEKMKSATVYVYTFPKLYYQFLDSYSPKTANQTHKLLNEVLKTTTAEQLLYSLVKRVRSLIMVKANRESDLAETAKMSSWQKDKLRKQASLWTERELKRAFIYLADLDEKIKTSTLTMSLANHLDILLISDLN